MKRLSPRELALLCAPITLLVAVPFIVSATRRIEPPRNPKAKIVFALAPRRDLKISPGQPVTFGWTAKATNSPQRRIDVRFFERIVATGQGHSLVLYQQPLSSGVKRLTNRSYYQHNITQGSEQGTEVGQLVQVILPTVPTWADKVEWQGEFVALPSAVGNSSPMSVPALRKLALTPGSAHLNKRFSLSFAKNVSDATT